MADDDSRRVSKHEEDALVLDFRLGTALDKGADMLTRTLFLNGEIEEANANRFIVALMTMDSRPGTIRVLLNSCGGAEQEGFAIYDAIRGCKNRVEIYGIGGVYSIAALILQAAPYRAMFPETKFMAHNGSIGIGGDIKSDDVAKLAKESRKSNQRYQRIIAERSGQSIKNVEDACLKERFFTAAEAVEFGVADEVVARVPDLGANLKTRKSKS